MYVLVGVCVGGMNVCLGGSVYAVFEYGLGLECVFGQEVVWWFEVCVVAGECYWERGCGALYCVLGQDCVFGLECVLGRDCALSRNVFWGRSVFWRESVF